MPDTNLAPATLPISTDPLRLFQDWMDEAKASEPNDPNAFAVATATPDGRPSVRMVLLKGFDARGFVFYTNGGSRKGGELAANPHVAMLFHWKTLRRQIRIEGPVSPVSEAESDEYFASRARISRLGAIASDQSRPLPSRGELERRIAEYDNRYPDDRIPRPANWFGWRVVPEAMEFWQDMPFRLHDRRVYRPGAGGWTSEALYP